MSHDLHATWAAAAVATYLEQNPTSCFSSTYAVDNFSVYAGREGRTVWPYADGALGVDVGGIATGTIALEYKRENEGVHGILTALGQSHAYLYKGYSGVAIVIPDKYQSHSQPGQYLRDLLNATSSDKPIGVFTYIDPDPSQPSPYLGKLLCHRGIGIGRAVPNTANAATNRQKVIETQWVHLREGSSTLSAFYEYLKIAKQLGQSSGEPVLTMPSGLKDAVLRRKKDPLHFLSFASGNTFHDKVWRHFWFSKIFTPTVMEIWLPRQNDTDKYIINNAATELVQADGVTPMVFFVTRKDSSKRLIINSLNAKTINEDQAWDNFAANVHSRAHSYREDVDSGLEHLGLLADDGRPSDLGYRFVDATERTGSLNKGTPSAILGGVLLQNGQLGALLHYIHRLSENQFRSNPFSFSISTNTTKKPATFVREDYLGWLEDKLANELRVMRKVSQRGGTPRKPFQAELTLLGQFGFIPQVAQQRFRVGVGLVVNWPAVQEAMSLPI